MNTTSMLQVRHVSKSYDAGFVLNDVSTDVSQGETVSIVGSSGAGKSTLLRCINHLEPCDRGTITLDGEMLGYTRRAGALHELKESTLCRQRREIGMVFQNFNLFGHLTVLDNVTLGPRKVLGRSRQDIETEALDLLDRVGLRDKAGAYPRRLSGGQQQRVAIARALAMHPKMLLFDEPTSALDPELVGEVLRVIRDLALTGITMMIVTHEIPFAMDVSDRILLMKDGAIVFDAPPQEWSTTNDSNAKTFLSHLRN